MKLEEARAKQLDAVRALVATDGIELLFDVPLSFDCCNPNLEADYALLTATQAAIEAQTVKCPCKDCNHGGIFDDDRCTWEDCPTCDGRGRIAK
jgi:Zn finger protein HypA/HybF involved in hydrogenase expression